MSEKIYTNNIYEYATFDIDENIDADATVEVNLRDLVFVKQALHLLWSANYTVMGKMLPKELDELYYEGTVGSPESPFYFKPKD